jgi:hypothetical protein
VLADLLCCVIQVLCSYAPCVSNGASRVEKQSCMQSSYHTKGLYEASTTGCVAPQVFTGCLNKDHPPLTASS